MTDFEILQTPCLIAADDGLYNELHLIVCPKQEQESVLRMNGDIVWSGVLPAGEQTIPFLIPEPKNTAEAVFTLNDMGEVRLSLRVPRHWEIHVVQLSHHDPGYTDVPSYVIRESGEWLEQALADMAEREHYGEEERYRIVVEQTYSIEQFFKTASPDAREQMIARIRRGDVEVTAFYANLISEILSPEEMLRALYPAQKIARETGVPIISAEHNDIPGFSWGYCTALCRAGIRFFVPGLPDYYAWGGHGLTSFWDTEAIFGSRNPGAFWWESAEGDRLLFWCNNAGCGGDCNPAMPALLPTLQRLEEEDWPHSVLRWPVQGGNRDNSSYIPDYADFIREWNQKYAYPHLVCSTETRFYHAFLAQLKTELPVFRGGVDGQDYPTASTSQMSSSAVARQTHSLFRHAEILYSLAYGDAEMYDQTARLQSAMQDMLLADEHAYGFTYPASKGQRASFWEHGVYAMRADANVHDVLAKSMASIADRVETSYPGYRMTVFNTSGLAGNYAVTAPLRDPDNCGTELHRSKTTGCLRIYELNNRMQVAPQEGYLEGKFILRDAQTGDEIPYVLDRVHWDDPAELSGLRDGIAAGTNRMGFFENPAGAALEIHCSISMPAYGYRTLELVPCEDAAALTTQKAFHSIENEYYRIRFDDTGLLGITDLSDGTELFDEVCGYAPCSVLIRNGNDACVSPMRVLHTTAWSSDVESVLIVRGEADGLYELVCRFSLMRGVDQIALDVRVVKNEKPLQTVFLCFPFMGDGVRYQGTLFDGKPAEMSLPGAHTDAIAVQDYVHCGGSDIVWNSANAPVVYLSHLWDGYISPAHRCIADNRIHQPLKPDAFDTGHIYSMLTCNNFGTNFFPSQLSSAVFSYTFAKLHGRDPAAWGMSANMRPTTILTDRSRGELPLSTELLCADGVRILALKQAEDGNGYILRLKNDMDTDVETPISVWGRDITLLAECDVVEHDIRTLMGHVVFVAANKIVTVRFRLT